MKAIEVFDESVWSQDEMVKHQAYATSKLEAERCAWRHQKESGIELVTIHPGYTFGEQISTSTDTSSVIVLQMMQGKIPVTVNVSLNCVDIFDIALAHLRAVERPEAANRRFLLSM